MFRLEINESLLIKRSKCRFNKNISSTQLNLFDGVYLSIYVIFNVTSKISEAISTSYFVSDLTVDLTIFTGKICHLINSVQGMAGWLLLIFLVCLHNQLYILLPYIKSKDV